MTIPGKAEAVAGCLNSVEFGIVAEQKCEQLTVE